MLFNKKPKIDPSQFVSDDERFGALNLLESAVNQFWRLTYVGINTDPAPQCWYKTKDDPHCLYLYDLLAWLMKQGEEKQIETLRRINNCFGSKNLRDIEIRPVNSMLYRVYLYLHPEDKQKIISLLFAVNPFLARRVDSEVPASLVKRTVSLITGQSTALITFDPKTGKSQLSLPSTSGGHLLLTGPKSDQTEDNKTQEFQPQYPGHISLDSVIAANLDKLVKSEFDVATSLQEAYRAGQISQALGQLYTVISVIIDNHFPSGTIVGRAQAQKTIKAFRAPAKLDNPKKTVFGNILAEAIEFQPDLKPIVIEGMLKLCQANEDLFLEIGWEYFNITIGEPYRPRQSEPIYDQRDIKPKFSPKARTEEPEAIWEIPTGSEQDPLSRLQMIFEKGEIELVRLKQYDTYCREVLYRILCGKTKPTPRDIELGFRTWQKIVHPDKSPEPIVREFSDLINRIAKVALKQEFLREEAVSAIGELHNLVKRMLISNSITIIPRQGQRFIIVGEISVADWLEKNNLDQSTIGIIINGAIVKDFTAGRLKKGDIMEIVKYS